MQKLVFLGSGNMASAIARGMRAQGAAYELGFFDIEAERAAGLAAELAGEAFGGLVEAVRSADILLLAVKPQAMAGLLAELARQDLGGKLVITIAAGLPLAFYEERLPELPVVRVMPNTSAAVLAAISGLMAGKFALAEHKCVAEEIFSAVGEVLWIDEADIHALTAISGSGPAYFYYFVECLAAAGERLGLAPEAAMKLARQTAIGSGAMLAARSVAAGVLREQVTSKGGTTEAALEVWQRGLPELTEAACGACAKRSEEMSRN